MINLTEQKAWEHHRSMMQSDTNQDNVNESVQLSNSQIEIKELFQSIIDILLVNFTLGWSFILGFKLKFNSISQKNHELKFDLKGP